MYENIPFTVSARTARLIGRENVAHAEGAIIELVKNCYDADADVSIVVINPVKKTILLCDNGSGMSEYDIREKWMHIGTDNKEIDYKTNRGRIKAGAKGIGRFALDRLGQKAVMYTLQDKQKNGYKWSANWNDFEAPKAKIGNVFATLEDQPNLSLAEVISKTCNLPQVATICKKYNFKHGTVIEIQNLRDEWLDLISDKVYQSLEVLTPPDGQARFDIFFINTSYLQRFGKIENQSFADYDYKVTATYKKNKARELTLDFHRNEFDYNLIPVDFFERPDMKLFPYDKRTFKKEKFSLSTTLYELLPGTSKSVSTNLTDTIGSFTFTFYFYKLGSSSKYADIFKYKNINTTARRKWSAKFGGIKLFRDNFRVRPYGEVNTASFDWLQLGERQGKNPAGVSRDDFAIKSNQVAGTISFSRTSKLFLDDKSGREGLIENDTFDLFKGILLGIIDEMEVDRSTIAANLNEYFAPEDDSVEALEIASEGDDADDAESQEQIRKKNKKLKKGIRSQQRKIEEIQEELVLSRALASAGILIASFSHEFHHMKNKLNSRTTTLKNQLLSLLPESKVKNLENRNNPYYLISQIKVIDDRIKQWLDFTLNLTKKDRRRSRKIDMLAYLNELKQTWKTKLADRGIALNVVSASSAERFSVKMIELDIDTIFDNLIANSIEAFQRNDAKGNRIIDITLSHEKEYVVFTYKDTGPGLSKDIRKPEDIFKPFVTTKRDKLGKEIGTGLGMWLLKSAVDYNKGSVKLFYPDSGFQIQVKLNAV